MKRKEPTVSVRIRESDYDILLSIMQQEGLKSITDAMSWCVHTAAQVSSR
jgi:hypothetical protein